MNIASRTSVPLGFWLGYQQSTLPQAASDLGERVKSAVMRVDYVGRPELTLGLESRLAWLPTRLGGETISASSTEIVLGYNF